jgi:hypothetical protein
LVSHKEKEKGKWKNPYLDFDILHRNGETHLDADAISRLLHFDDIAATHEMDRETDIDDLNGPATIQDLNHLNQLIRLNRFFDRRPLANLKEEVRTNRS